MYSYYIDSYLSDSRQVNTNIPVVALYPGMSHAGTSDRPEASDLAQTRVTAPNYDRITRHEGLTIEEFAVRTDSRAEASV